MVAEWFGQRLVGLCQTAPGSQRAGITSALDYMSRSYTLSVATCRGYRPVATLRSPGRDRRLNSRRRKD